MHRHHRPRFLERQNPSPRLVEQPLQPLPPPGHFNRVTWQDVVIVVSLVLGGTGFVLAALALAGGLG
jgi:hypothetical protein